MHQRRLLRLEQRTLFARVGDLEDEARAVRSLDPEILIALAGELRGAPIGAEVLARHALGGAKVEAWAVLEHDARS